MFSLGSKFVAYYSLNVRTSSASRVKRRSSTNFVVVSRETGEVLVDLQHLGDFGYTAVKARGGKLLPINKQAAKIQKELQASGAPHNFHSINVLNPNNPNKKFLLGNPLTFGVTEEWQAVPICGKPVSFKSTFTTLFREPSTALLSLKNTKQLVDIGLFGGKGKKSTFFKSPGLYRSLSINKVTFSSKNCPGGKGGEFYTDVNGNALDGPGKGAVRQFFEPRLSITIDGPFETVDSWFGLHFEGAVGSFVNHGMVRTRIVTRSLSRSLACEYRFSLLVVIEGVA